MPTKKIEKEVEAPVAVEAVKPLPISAEFHREDMNLLKDTVNALIEYIK